MRNGTKAQKNQRRRLKNPVTPRSLCLEGHLGLVSQLEAKRRRHRDIRDIPLGLQKGPSFLYYQKKSTVAFSNCLQTGPTHPSVWGKDIRINLEKQILLRLFFTRPVEILLLWYCFWFIAWIRSIQDKWEVHSKKKMIPAADLLSPSLLPLLQNPFISALAGNIANFFPFPL